MVKNFNSISTEVITDEFLLRPGIHILATRYLEKRVFCFTKVIRNNKKINEKVKTVFNLKKEIKIKKSFYNEKKDVQALLLAAACLSAALSVFVLELLALFMSAIPLLVPALSIFLSPSAVPLRTYFASLSIFVVPVHVPRLSALLFLFAVSAFYPLLFLTCSSLQTPTPVPNS